MIIDKISNIDQYGLVHDNLNKALNYIKTTDLYALPLGKTQICESDVFLNIVEYTPKEQSPNLFEVHRDFIDIHIVLSSKEYIDIGHLDDLFDEEEYNKKNDFLNGSCTVHTHIELDQGYFLVAFPTDAHRFSVCTSNQKIVKKLVVKVRV